MAMIRLRSTGRAAAVAVILALTGWSFALATAAPQGSDEERFKKLDAGPKAIDVSKYPPLLEDELLDVHFPHTAEDHLAVQPAPPRKRGKTFLSEKRAKPSKDPVAAYRTHCETYIRGAEVLADEADRLAEFHRARARELRETKDP